eukprot:SAG11_NODE_13651_length_645_cov_1.130037_1_plen_125_part_10
MAENPNATAACAKFSFIVISYFFLCVSFQYFLFANAPSFFGDDGWGDDHAFGSPKTGTFMLIYGIPLLFYGLIFRLYVKSRKSRKEAELRKKAELITVEIPAGMGAGQTLLIQLPNGHPSAGATT